MQRPRLEKNGVCQITVRYIICLKTRGTLSRESQRDVRFSRRYLGCSAIVHSDTFIHPDVENRKDSLKRCHISTILQDVTSQKENQSPSNSPFKTRRFIDACLWTNPSYRAIHSLRSSSIIYPSTPFSGGHAVAQLVEALRYKPEGRGFDSRRCHWIFLLT